MPLATVITPNLSEAETFVGSRIYNLEGQKTAAQKIYEEIHAYREGKMPERPLAIIVKGGHLKGEAVDVLYDGREIKEFGAPRVPGRSPRGTGCRFSSAIAAGLVKGLKLAEAVREAKKYLTDYISKNY